MKLECEVDVQITIVTPYYRGALIGLQICLGNQWFEHAIGHVVGFFCLGQGVGGDWWVVVQKEARTQWVLPKVVDLTIGININGVFVDMHAIDAIRGAARFEKKEGMLVVEVE